MTPPARIATAIEIIDRVLAGEAAEKALTSWARGSRFAGSKDRAAVRDLVFDALRCLRSFAAMGGAMSGRGVMLGALRVAGQDGAAVFTSEGYAPTPLTLDERAGGRTPEGAEALDCPNWLAPILRASLGEEFAPVMHSLQSRAPVFLRVNLARTTRDAAAARLADEAVTTRPHPLSPSALEVTEGARRIQATQSYLEGWVELQDAASQAVVDTLPLTPDAKVLDNCAGGGGKVLAMAGRAACHYYAWDAQPERMRDLPARAARAGAEVALLTDPASAAPYDLVLCDAPCSGSGAWRRSPEGKWRLDQAGLDRLLALQAKILDEAAMLVGPGGVLAYSTCSLIEAENGDQVAAFLARQLQWIAKMSRSLTPRDGGDGFFIAHLTRER